MTNTLKNILTIILKKPLYFYHAIEKDKNIFYFTIFKYGKFDKSILTHILEMNAFFPNINITIISKYAFKTNYYIDLQIQTKENVNKETLDTIVKLLR